MRRSTPFSWLPIYQWLAGLCDSVTGILLLFAPAWTLKLMGVREMPQPVAFVSFIGAFVLSVGLACFYAARLPRKSAHAARWQSVWFLTALSRSLVAIFLAWKILARDLEPAWTTVALTDGVMAALQWTGLSRGWLNFKDS